MDKLSSEQAILKNCLSSLDLDKLASESGWSPRSRKVSALNWCLALCLASAHRAPSLRVAAHFMGLVNLLTVTKQALHKRLRAGGAKLIEKALESAIATKAHLAPQGRLKGFRRVLAQDSACIKLPKALRRHFPGSRNQVGSSAVMRIQAIYDMAGDGFVEFALSGFDRNDQAAALDALEHVGQGDLVLRDLGYFTLESLESIDCAGAYFLSRYKNGVALFDPRTGAELDLLGILRAEGSLDREVLAGAGARLKVRLVAIPLKEEVANRRRQKAKANRDRRCKPGKRALELLGWQVMLTNCSAERLPVERIHELYSMRWRIETIFKAWKSGLRLDEVGTHTSKAMLEATIHAGLLRVTLVHAVVIPWLEARDPTRKVSVCKLMDLISASAAFVGNDAAANENLLENLSKHCRYERRKRTNTMQKWDQLVTDMENLS